MQEDYTFLILNLPPARKIKKMSSNQLRNMRAREAKKKKKNK